MPTKEKDDAENVLDKRCRYTDATLSFVEPLIEQAEDMEATLSRLGKQMREAPFEVDTGCGSTKRNPLIAEYCELSKCYRLLIAQLMEVQDTPKESSAVFEMRHRAALLKIGKTPEEVQEA